MNQRERHLKIGSCAADLLVQLGDILSELIEGLEYPSLAAHHGLDGVREFKRLQMNQERRLALYRLKQRGMLEEKKIGDRVKRRLTERGKVEYLYQKIAKSEVLPEGHACLVVFDIPESRRDVRQRLRKLLTKLDFYRIQQSVWASPFDAGDELSSFLKMRKERNWVLIYTGKRYV